MDLGNNINILVSSRLRGECAETVMCLLNDREMNYWWRKCWAEIRREVGTGRESVRNPIIDIIVGLFNIERVY